MKLGILEKWANTQPDGRPAEYRWRPLLNAAVWLTPTTRVLCSNAAKTRNQLKLAGVPQSRQPISFTCPHNMVNTGPLTTEICWRVWGTPANFNWFRVLVSLLHRRRSTEANQTLHDV